MGHPSDPSLQTDAPRRSLPLPSLRFTVRCRFKSAAIPAAALGLLATFLVVYLPDIGQGFLRDDFRWIRASRVDSLSQLADLFRTNVGFYRPLVSVSFAADYTLWGLNAFGYAVTNLALCLGNAALIYALARRLDLARGAALVAAAVWMFNFHAINMSLLWLSGRTSLVALVFSLLAAIAFVSRPTPTRDDASGRAAPVVPAGRATTPRLEDLLTGLLCLAAVLSKEEAVLLPAVLAAFVWLDAPGAAGHSRLRQAAARTWPAWLALGVYLLLRSRSGAFAASDAPEYYRFVTDPALLLRNVAEYADRAGTVAVGVTLIMGFLAGLRRPWFVEPERRALRMAVLWVPAMYALTVLLPVRSSLYALIPSAGAALAVGAVASRAARVTPLRFQRTAVVLILVAAVLVPVYRSRNVRWVAPAVLSAGVVETIAAATSSFPDGGSVVLVDAPARELGLDDVFDALLPDAMDLVAGSAWTGRIVQAGDVIPPDTAIAFELSNGGLEPVPVRRR